MVIDYVAVCLRIGKNALVLLFEIHQKIHGSIWSKREAGVLDNSKNRLCVRFGPGGVSIMRVRLLSSIQYILRNARFIIRVADPPLIGSYLGDLFRPQLLIKPRFQT